MKQGNVICFILKQQTTNDIEKIIVQYVYVHYHVKKIIKCFQIIGLTNLYGFGTISCQCQNVMNKYLKDITLSYGFMKNDIGFSFHETTETDAKIHMYMYYSHCNIHVDTHSVIKTMSWFMLMLKTSTEKSPCFERRAKA